MTLNPQQSRRTALALLFVAIAAVVAVVGVPAWLLHRHYDRVLEDQMATLDRYRRIAGTRPEIAKRLQAMRQFVETNGGKLITMQAPVSREEGRYRMVSVNVQLTANIQALRKILDAVDAHTPFLFVDNLMIRSQVPGSFRPQPGQEPEMFVQFDVYGYTLPAQT
jgi:hypothetical protein